MSKPFPIPIAMFLPETQPTAAQRFGAEFTRWALNLSLVGALLGVAFFGYVMLWPIPTLHYNNLPLPVVTKTLHPGDPIPLLVDYCKSVANSEHVVGQIVGTDNDHVILAMGGLDRNLDPGCHMIHTRIWHVPTDAQPGSYRAYFTLSYQLFNLRTITVNSYSEPFTIINQ